MIVFGLYLVLWGKDKELKKVTRVMGSKRSTIPAIEESGRESFGGLSNCSNVIVVAPKFAPKSGVAVGFILDDGQEEDLEAKVSSKKIKT